MTVLQSQIVLGSLSDWAMIMVSIATLALLYSNLQSQLKVQEISRSLFNIERDRQLNEIKPDFNCWLDDNGEDQNYRYYRLTLTSNSKQYKNLSYRFTDKMVFFEEVKIRRGVFDNFPSLGFKYVKKPMARVAHLWIRYEDPVKTVYEIRYELFLNKQPNKVGPYKQGVIFESNVHELEDGYLASFDLGNHQSNVYKNYDEENQGPHSRLKFF